MSRVSEVEAEIISADDQYCEGAWIGPESLRHLARALAAEVDAERQIITKLLEILKPGGVPYKNGQPTDDQYEIEKWRIMCDLFARACEIAGRTE